MLNRRERLRLNADILSLIDRRRQETGDAELGRGIERWILESEWGDLEREILENPGALESLLIPLRRGEC